MTPVGPRGSLSGAARWRGGGDTKGGGIVTSAAVISMSEESDPAGGGPEFPPPPVAPARPLQPPLCSFPFSPFLTQVSSRAGSSGACRLKGVDDIVALSRAPSLAVGTLFLP